MNNFLERGLLPQAGPKRPPILPEEGNLLSLRQVEVRLRICQPIPESSKSLNQKQTIYIIIITKITHGFLFLVTLWLAPAAMKHWIENACVEIGLLTVCIPLAQCTCRNVPKPHQYALPTATPAATPVSCHHQSMIQNDCSRVSICW